MILHAALYLSALSAASPVLAKPPTCGSTLGSKDQVVFDPPGLCGDPGGGPSNFAPLAPVPEPSTFALLGAGAFAAYAGRRYSRRRARDTQPPRP